MATYVYSSGKVTVVLGGKVATGLADGDFLKITFADDYVNRTMGTDGIAALSLSFNESADMELSLMASSPYNDYLSAVFQAQRNGIIGLPFLARDSGGTSLHAAPLAYITKMPDKTYSRNVATIVWPIGTGNMTSFIGGNSLAT